MFILYYLYCRLEKKKQFSRVSTQVPRRRLPQHPDLRPAQPAGARQHHGAHSAVELGADLQLRVPHASQQARWPVFQRPHAVPGVPVHPARLHQRDAGPAGPQHLQVRHKCSPFVRLWTHIWGGGVLEFN